MTSPLKFDVRGLKAKGRLEMSRSVAAAAGQEGLAGLAILRGPMLAKFEFESRGSVASVRGRVSGEWELECSRCLKPGACAYSAEVSAEFPASTEEFDAEEDVRQALVLAVPMQFLCEPDCKGLCPRCGGNRNLRDCGCPE